MLVIIRLLGIQLTAHWISTLGRFRFVRRFKMTRKMKRVASVKKLNATSVLVAIAFVLALFLQASAASHFRYGTLSWVPKGSNKVEFTLTAAYQADYNWGKFPLSN